MKSKKVYISGPISGLERGEVETSFQNAESLLRSWGHVPVSPLKNGLPYDAPWQMHMERDLEILGECDMLYLIETDRTGQSVGCRMELMEARRLGIAVISSSETLMFAS